MRTSISCHLFLYHRMAADGVLEAVSKSGFSEIELWAMQPHFPYYDEKGVGEIAAVMKKNNVSASSAHLPMYEAIHGPNEPRKALSPSETDEEARKRWIEHAYAASSAAIRVGAKVLTLHSEIDFPNPPQKSVDAFHKSIEALLNKLPSSGFVLGVENGPGGLSQVSGAMSLIERYPKDKVGVTLDVGHVNVGGSASDAVEMVGSRLKSVHAHDNGGLEDEHLAPGKGTLPWGELRESLAKADFAGPLVWEVRDVVKGADPGLKIKSKILEDIKKFDERFTRP